jgi:hypothetical protein
MNISVGLDIPTLCQTSLVVMSLVLSLGLSSERAPYMKKEESNCQTKKIKIWSWALKGARHQDELAD